MNRFPTINTWNPTRQISILFFILLAMLQFPRAVAAENWIRYAGTTLKLPGGNGAMVNGYSESFYDSDSIRRLGDYRVEVWLKDSTYLGDIEPHIHKELLKIDCSGNRFTSMVEPDRQTTPETLREINSGTIGDASPYRIVREAVCGY